MKPKPSEADSVSVIRLGAGDSAFVFRADGSFEGMLPEGQPDEHLGDACMMLTDHAAKAAALVLICAKPGLLQKIVDTELKDQDS